MSVWFVSNLGPVTRVTVMTCQCQLGGVTCPKESPRAKAGQLLK